MSLNGLEMVRIHSTDLPPAVSATAWSVVDGGVSKKLGHTFKFALIVPRSIGFEMKVKYVGT